MFEAVLASVGLGYNTCTTATPIVKVDVEVRVVDITVRERSFDARRYPIAPASPVGIKQFCLPRLTVVVCVEGESLETATEALLACRRTPPLPVPAGSDDRQPAYGAVSSRGGMTV